MARVTPRVERTCLVCDTAFEGTPASTRCPACRIAGLRVPKERQTAQRRRPIKERPPRPVKETPGRPMYEKRCRGCGEGFTTGNARAARCKPCLEDNIPITAEFTFIERTQEEIDAEREAGRKAKRKKRAQKQLQDLERLSTKPKGMKAMTTKTAESALGVLWLELCHSDGQPNGLLRDQQLDDATKTRMLTSYLRLRLRGYTTEAVFKVCPVALMAQPEAALDAEFRDLPKVTESADDGHDRGFDPLEGLNDDLRAEVIDFTHQQEHRAMAQCLRLT